LGGREEWWPGHGQKMKRVLNEGVVKMDESLLCYPSLLKYRKGKIEWMMVHVSNLLEDNLQTAM